MRDVFGVASYVVLYSVLRVSFRLNDGLTLWTQEHSCVTLKYYNCPAVSVCNDDLVQMSRYRD